MKTRSLNSFVLVLAHLDIAPGPDESGRGVDARSDIYSLGIVLYELVTGRRPFTADTPMPVILEHVTRPLPSPRDYVSDLPDDVVGVLYTALAKLPEDRYPD